MIKLILFDLDDCLFDTTELSSFARSEALNAMINYGLKVDFKEGLRMLREVVNEYGSNHPNHFDILLKRLKSLDPNSLQGVSQDKLISAAVIAYHQVKVKNIRPFPDVIPFLIKVKEIYPALKFGIVTDGIPVKQFEKILRLKIDKYFDDIIISDEIGIRKPNPRMLSYALDKMKTKAEETLLIGDRIDRDIEPAKILHMHTVLTHRKTKYDTPLQPATNTRADFEIRDFSEIFPILEMLAKLP